MALEKLAHELKQVGLVTLYFLSCFVLLLALKKLFLAEYEVEFYGVSAALVAALVVGKVVVLLNHTSAGNRFDQKHALWLGVVYKTAIYTGVTALVITAEKLFHAYREEGALGPALEHVWHHRERSVMLASILCIGVAFAGYHLWSAVDRRLGEGSLVRMLLGRPG